MFAPQRYLRLTSYGFSGLVVISNQLTRKRQSYIAKVHRMLLAFFYQNIISLMNEVWVSRYYIRSHFQSFIKLSWFFEMTSPVFVLLAFVAGLRTASTDTNYCSISREHTMCIFLVCIWLFVLQLSLMINNSTASFFAVFSTVTIDYYWSQ